MEESLPMESSMNAYSSHCDDFGLYTYLNTELALPTERETVLHFFDSLQRCFPEVNHFYCRDTGEFVLEQEKENGSYRWITLEPQRLCSGHVNPSDLADADALHERVLEYAPHHLGISPLDCEALDVICAFDLVFNGNHDDVIAEALGLTGTLESLLGLPDARVINCEPSIMISLDESLRLQCRLNIETRTNAYQVRTGQFHDEPITIYFTVRQYWAGKPYDSFVESYRRQREICLEMLDEHIIPNVIQPVAQVIAAK